jgi:hypothetical protein
MFKIDSFSCLCAKGARWLQVFRRCSALAVGEKIERNAHVSEGFGKYFYAIVVNINIEL